MSTTKIGHITVALYMHPELYPPVLSAIDELSRIAQGITIITRQMLVSKWDYPDNVTLQYINPDLYQGFDIERIDAIKKINHFVRFIKDIKQTLKHNKSDILIVHDVIPLWAAYLIRRFLKKNGIKLWYHNHDVTDKSKAGRFSLMGIATSFESKAFSCIDCFSLPAKERLVYFPIQTLKNPPIILPNFPLRRFYSKIVKKNPEIKKLKLVYQGSIGPGHGLEIIVSLLKTKIKNRQLELHLVGKVRPAYKAKLFELAKEYKVVDFLVDHGMQPFAELPQYLSQFDVGLAIHEPYNITYSTGGSASNKIYEYAACGLPVLLMDNIHYRSYLSEYKWTYFTTLEKESLINNLEKITDTYSLAQTTALEDFENILNYETIFSEKFLTIKKHLLY